MSHCLLLVSLISALAAEPVPVQGDRIAVLLSQEKRGAVVSLRDRPTGAEFVDAGAAEDLFLISYTQPGDALGRRKWLASRSAERVEWRRGRDAVTLVFKRIGGRDVHATCRVWGGDTGDVRWSLRVTGREPIVIEEVKFPILELRAPLKGDGANDAFVAGITKGGVYRNPSQWKPGWSMAVSQPGPLAAQFGCYYSPKAGLLSHTRDNRGYPKTLEFRRTKRGVRWTWRRRAFHRLGEPFDLGYEISTRTFAAKTAGEPADWRDAADLYKQWALKQPWCATRYADRTDIPDWMKAGPAMIRFSRHWLSDPARVEVWLREYWGKSFSGTPLIVALWGWERVGSWVSPKYFPPFPSEEGFARVVAAAKAAGGHAFPWPSGYYWNVEYRKKPDGSFEWTDWDDFKKTGMPHALINRDGSPMVVKRNWLQGGRNAVLCRGDAWTREWFNRSCVELMKRGCDMVQVDQVVGAAAPGNGNCFSTQHGHPPGPGVWDMDAFRDQLRSLAKACREVQPGAVLSIEEPQEFCNQLIGVQDYRDYQTKRWPKLPGLVQTSVFGYLYHEFLPVFQSNPRRGDRLNLAYCIVTGQIPHWVPHWPVVPAPMLTNGGMEEWAGAAPRGWQKVKGWKGKAYAGKAFRDEQTKHSGAASLRLENAAGDTVQVSQNVSIGPGALEAGRTYRMRVWLKVEHMAKPNGIGLAALTRKLKGKGSWRILFPRPGDWQQRSVEFTMPEGADFLRIMIHVNGAARLWVDDAAIDVRVGGEWRPLMNRGKPMEHDLVKQWVELFHGAGRPYLLLGKMLRPPKLLSPTAAGESHAPFAPILLNAFEAPDGSKAAVAVNVSGAAQDVAIQWLGRTRRFRMEPWQVRMVDG